MNGTKGNKKGNLNPKICKAIKNDHINQGQQGVMFIYQHQCEFTINYPWLLYIFHIVYRFLTSSAHYGRIMRCTSKISDSIIYYPNPLGLELDMRASIGHAVMPLEHVQIKT